MCAGRDYHQVSQQPWRFPLPSAPATPQEPKTAVFAEYAQYRRLAFDALESAGQPYDALPDYFAPRPMPGSMTLAG